MAAQGGCGGGGGGTRFDEFHPGGAWRAAGYGAGAGQDQEQGAFDLLGSFDGPGFAIFSKTFFMWEEKNNTLYRKFEFKDFSQAFAFMTRVALAAEKMDHHPLWTNVYNQVEVWLSTHDAGDVVTDKDRQLAKKIDAIVK